MVNLSRLLVSFCFVIRCLTATALAPSPVSEVILSPGDSKALDLAREMRVVVSRRGVVNVFQDEGGRWFATALNVGLAMLTASPTSAPLGEGEPPPEERRILVRVVRPDEAWETGRQREHSAALPEWLCTNQGILCQHGARIITGHCDDALWFVQARQYAHQHQPLLLSVDLSSKARADLKTIISERLPPGSVVEVAPSGLIKLQRSCPGDRPLPDLPLPTGLLWQQTCLGVERQASYRLDARLLRVSEQDMERLGGDAQSELGWQWQFGGNGTLLLQGASMNRLTFAMNEQKLEVLAAPSLRLVEGVVSKSKIGGEFLSAPSPTKSGRALGPASTQAWKPYGFNLEAKLEQIFASGLVRLRYALSLSMRDQGAPSMQHQEIEGAVDLPLKTPQIVAVLDFDAEDQRGSGTLGLQSLPILGPLFRFLVSSREKSRALLWFHLALLADGEDLRPTSPAWPEYRP